ncbi:phage tail protein [Brevibacterium yomogidense]|uniref:phage tail protein n=1 Tax=Brevibacterium yomogidense TaxID=946573 RepID=UPI0018DF5041|nr:tape measure protein [Brevibacterium yomogidense]
MAAVELGTAYVQLTASARGLGKSVAKEFGAVDKHATSAGRNAGSRLMAAAGAAAKKAAAGALVAAGVAAGAAVVSGFKSAVNQQQAKAVLTGLYDDAAKAGDTMKQLRAVSKASPLDYSSYLEASQALAYAGVEGTEAVGVLKNVGKTIVGAGGDSEKLNQAMGGVLKAVNNGGIAMMDSLSMISESGAPILAALGEDMGTTTDKVKKMASEGAISVEDVLRVLGDESNTVMQKYIKAGDSASTTFANQWKMATDNISSSIGETLVPMLDSIAPAMKPISDAIVDGIEKLPEIFEKVTNAVRENLGVLKNLGIVVATATAAFATYKLTVAAITIGTAAWNVVTNAARIATAGWAVQQRLLNAAFKANPIGIVITIIAGLVAAVILAYNNFEWFRNVVDTAWAAIKNAISVVVDWFVNTAWPWMKEIITAIGDWFVNLYQNYIKPAWDGIWGAIQTAWGYIEPVFNFIVTGIRDLLMVYFQLLWVYIQLVWKGIQIAIKAAWVVIKIIFDAIVAFVKNVLGPIFNWLWNNIIKPVWNFIVNYIKTAWAGMKITFQAIKSFIDNVLGPVFRWLRDNVVKPVWDGIKTAIDTVWKFVRDKVFDPMVNAVKNTLPNAFEKGKDAIGKAWDKVRDVAKKPIKFVIDTVINKGIIDNFNKIASTFNVDKIDRVSLPKGFATGGWTGAGRKYQPAGVVHADEYVIRKESQQKLSRTYGRGVLDHMNRFGSIPGLGYAKGGMVWNNLWGIVKDEFPWARLTSAYRPGSRTASGNSSYHSRGMAVDLAGPRSMDMPAMMKIFNFLAKNYGQSKELIHSPAGGRQIKNGRNYTYTGAVKRMHYNHVHWANDKPFGGPTAAADGGGGFDFSGLLSPFSGLFDKIKEGIDTTGAFGKMAAGAAKKMVQAPIDWITDKAAALGEFVSGAVDTVSTRFAKEQVRTIAHSHGWGFGEQWRAIVELVQRESTWRTDAANPDSTARGLFQKMTSLHGPVEKTAATQAIWGLNYIKRTYGNPAAALRFHDRNNYYATGGLVKPTLFDRGGILQPGMSLVANQTRKPEYILPAHVTENLMNGGGGGFKIAEHMTVQAFDMTDAMREMERRVKRKEMLHGGVTV